ncbi:uncharacterized protein LOC131956833 isoform X2 [Physella acuta]|uniref:uncharacterized protein LOC131956833 isoform X1 n=1 Tax=Physella acuta TaxID=109671 RepID=UPI0027DDF460|nr:uncharacterized protein LOC131956833 isoform X1 [Physella acuta]XP_059177421.1 uncharacterized protein LOC131956833 isoform X2 [Physella acuta]
MSSKIITEEVVLEKDENWQNNMMKCKKKDNHGQFVDMGNKNTIEDDIRKNTMPGFIMTGDIFRTILLIASLTCRVVVPLDNRSNRFGTGFVEKIRRRRGSCPCPECKTENPRTEFAVFKVTTVLHVVPEQSQAENSVFELFCDDESEQGIKKLYGRRLADTDKERGNNDWCFVECVTHDVELISKLEQTIKEFNDLQKKLYQQYKNNKEKQLVVIVSHPHGGPKRISFGQTVEKKSLKDVRENQNWCNYSYNTATCPGSSGAYVFILGQPLCGSGYWFGHPHNHSHYNVEHFVNCSSIGVDTVA